MNREQIIEMALQVFDEHPYDAGHVVSPDGYTWIDDKLVEFAALVAAAEREECAKVCEELGKNAGPHRIVFDAFAEAIRARGQQ